MNTKVDYIVVGQGLAGTLVCWMLEERGRKFVVFDQGHAGSSSNIAAGIINPVTGRRYVKSWMYDELLPTALACYSNMEMRLNVTLLRQRNILRYLPDFKSENDWLSKSAKPGYHTYILSRAETEETSQLDLGGMWGEVTNSYQLDIGTLISSYRRHLREKSLLREQVFDSELLLKCRDTQTIYGLSFERIVFCEGHLVSNNRLFASDFLNPSKGEVLILRIPG
ncbi:MAG: FAD-binding oxidoreductase, partial [Saprospiraceae bacterium]|nr:FAD-binding oxidoreductase [Saprospiraceae bacterium]